MPFVSPISAGSEITPYDFDVKELLIITESEQVDVTYLLSELNINESLFTKCITGSLVLTDSLNLISNLPVMEGDLIKGLIARNDKDPAVAEFDPDFELEFTFEIVKVSSQTKVKQDVQMISIAFVSSTWTDHLASRISKSYRQMPYSDMVTDIYNLWLQRGGLRGELPLKGLAVTPTDQLWNIVIPNMKAYDAITFLSKRAFQGTFANYLFWEDKNQFNFRPIEELIAAGTVADYWSDTSDQYTKDINAQVPDLGVLAPRYLGITNLKFLEYHDITASAMNGMLGNRLIKHDIFNKRVTDYYPFGEIAPNYLIEPEFKYYDEYGKTSHVDGAVELVKPYTNDKMGLGDTLLTVYPDHVLQWDDQESFEPEKWIRQRACQIAQLKFIKLQATTPGNFTRKVGDKILIKMYSPEYKPKTGAEGPEYDSKFQGAYIITALRRKFTKDQCVNVMEIIKDNYFSLENRTYEPTKETPRIKLDGKGQVRGL